MATTKLMCTQIKKQVGIILKKTASVPEKSHQANQSIDLLVQHEKKSMKNCEIVKQRQRKKKKWMCLAKSQYYMNKILWKTIILQWKERRKNLSANQWINLLMLWTKFFEKLSLCNEGKERKKKKDFFLPFFATKKKWIIKKTASVLEKKPSSKPVKRFAMNKILWKTFIVKWRQRKN